MNKNVNVNTHKNVDIDIDRDGGSTWYQPQYSGTGVQYLVVNPVR